MSTVDTTRVASRPPLISRDFVLMHRRRRLAAAAAEVLHEFGPPGATVSALVRSAGTARNSFYDVFDNRDDCLAFAVADAHTQLLAPVRTATSAKGDWSLRVEAAISGFYAAVIGMPLTAELLLVHSASISRSAGRSGLEASVLDLTALLAQGRGANLRRRATVPESAETFWAGVVLAGASKALRDGDLRVLPRTGHEITKLIDVAFLESKS